MFPLTVEGTAPADSANASTAVDAVEEALHRARATEITRDGHQIDFRVSWNRMPPGSFDLLRPIRSGTVSVSPDGARVSYRFTLTRGLWFWLVLDGLLVATGFDLVSGILLLAGLVAINLCVDYAITARWFPKYLTDAIAATTRPVHRTSGST